MGAQIGEPNLEQLVEQGMIDDTKYRKVDLVKRLSIEGLTVLGLNYMLMAASYAGDVVGFADADATTQMGFFSAMSAVFVPSLYALMKLNRVTGYFRALPSERVEWREKNCKGERWMDFKEGGIVDQLVSYANQRTAKYCRV